MHACDNPGCVKLQHLTIGTQRDNILDAQAKGRFRKRHTNECQVCGAVFWPPKDYPRKKGCSKKCTGVLLRAASLKGYAKRWGSRTG